MAEATAESHLIRAFRLIDEASGRIQEFAQQMTTLQTSDHSDMGFLRGMAATARESAATGAMKSKLDTDLRLAESEITAAEALDAEASVQIQGRIFALSSLRAALFGTRGIIEYINGKKPYARQCLEYAAGLEDTAAIQFWLGLLAKDEKDSQRALQHFERSLALDPNGEMSIPALREADEARKRLQGGGGCALLLIPLLGVGIAFGIRLLT